MQQAGNIIAQGPWWIQGIYWVAIFVAATFAVEWRWQREIKKWDDALDRKVNEIINNKRQRELEQSGRLHEGRPDAGAPGRVSKAKFRRS